MKMDFNEPDLLDMLDSATDTELDALDFGVIKTDRNAIVVGYNQTESAGAGIRPERVLGEHLFTAVAPCTNNYLVASRFEEEDALDATLDYVFTLRMRPTPVRLRLLKGPRHAHMYMLVLRKASIA